MLTLPASGRCGLATDTPRTRLDALLPDRPASPAWTPPGSLEPKALCRSTIHRLITREVVSAKLDSYCEQAKGQP